MYRCNLFVDCSSSMPRLDAWDRDFFIRAKYDSRWLLNDILKSQSWSGLCVSDYRNSTAPQYMRYILKKEGTISVLGGWKSSFALFNQSLY